MWQRTRKSENIVCKLYIRDSVQNMWWMFLMCKQSHITYKIIKAWPLQKWCNILKYKSKTTCLKQKTQKYMRSFQNRDFARWHFKKDIRIKVLFKVYCLEVLLPFPYPLSSCGKLTLSHCETVDDEKPDFNHEKMHLVTRSHYKISFADTASRLIKLSSGNSRFSHIIIMTNRKTYTESQSFLCCLVVMQCVFNSTQLSFSHG